MNLVAYLFVLALRSRTRSWRTGEAAEAARVCTSTTRAERSVGTRRTYIRRPHMYYIKCLSCPLRKQTPRLKADLNRMKHEATFTRPILIMASRVVLCVLVALALLTSSDATKKGFPPSLAPGCLPASDGGPNLFCPGDDGP